ncbi:MAG: family transcriptional regulator [Herbinix sp.]|nr:family transcriptional regulator [Herbinix sp.]
MSEYEVGLYRIIGEMIREKRTISDLTLEQVAEQIGVTRKTLQRYETGERKIKISTIMDLASILKFDYDAFMAEAKARLVGNDTSLVKEESRYYTNSETQKIAQEIFEDKDMKLLFDLKKSAQADRLMDYARYLKEQYDKENGI